MKKKNHILDTHTHTHVVFGHYHTVVSQRVSAWCCCAAKCVMEKLDRSLARSSPDHSFFGQS